MRSLTLASILLLLSACGGVRAPRPASSAADPASAELPREVHWVRNSAEYPALFEQTYRLATAALERRAAGREPGTWGVILDADETLISNSQQSAELAQAPPGTSFEESWGEWVERRSAPVLPGVIEFLSRVRELGGRVAVVTNRRERHCPQTADNLRRIEVPFDVILCRTDVADKAPRWARVAAGEADPELPPIEIVMWLGDNIHDFPGLEQEARFAGPEEFEEFGDRFFILPNPMYGSWEDNPPD